MTIKFKRYHFILSVGLICAFGAAGIFSIETIGSLKEEIPEPAALPKKQVSKPKVSKSATLDTDAAKPASKARASTRSGLATAPASKTEKNIALTFDDGPHPKFTQRLLKILKEHRVHSTFFVVGKQVRRYPELLQMIFRDGHEIGNHTTTHPDLRTLSAEEQERELEETHRLVESITDQAMRFFRPPGGHHNPEIVRRAGDIGYKMALWTVFTRDHSNPPMEVIKERVIKSAARNGIVLLHSGIENTLSALPEIIATLRDQGYRFVTLTDLEQDKALPRSVMVLADRAR